MKKVAVMLDGRFVLKKLQERLHERPSAAQVFEFALACVSADEQEELLRVYYYDCPPYGLIETNPLSGHTIDFSQTNIFKTETALQTSLARMDHIAFRKGVLSFKGWKIGKKASRELMRQRRSVVAEDLVPDLEQKQVDMKIGLDIAWLSSKNIVNRIILVTGDADFIPVMKFARREGVQIVLVTLNHGVKAAMKEHTDIFREVKWPSGDGTNASSG
ncbi:MAG: NYN domain-containing protein [Deltaproteobacteria bacterium]|nr:NYN domain-containing protein [Deltaproteobacteria bacterium]